MFNILSCLYTIILTMLTAIGLGVLSAILLTFFLFGFKLSMKYLKKIACIKFCILLLIPSLLFAGEVYIDGQSNEGHIIQNEGSTLSQQPILDFQGANVNVANSGSKSIVTISGVTTESDPLSWLATGDQSSLSGTKSGSYNLSTSGPIGAGAITGTSFIIGANTLTTSEWAFLDGQDQAVKTTSSPLFDQLTLTSPTQDYLITSRAHTLALQSQTATQASVFGLYSKTGNGTENINFHIFGKGLPTDITNYELFQIQYNSGGTLSLGSFAGGTGTVRPLVLYTGANTSQLYLDTSGNVGIGMDPVYKLDVSGTINASNLRATGEAGLVIASNGYISIGTNADSRIGFAGTGLSIQSDLVTATDYLQLRGGTNGIDFNIGSTEQITLTDGKLAPTTDNGISFGDSTHAFKEIYSNKYFSADNSEGWTGSFIDNDGNTITVKNGLITAKTAP